MEPSEIIDLNVGGVYYSTTLKTLTMSEPDSFLAEMFLSFGQPNSGDSSNSDSSVLKDSKGRYFIDRDGTLFRYVLDFLRTGQLILPAMFREKCRLVQEADYYKLFQMREALLAQSSMTTTAMMKMCSPVITQPPPLPPIKSGNQTVQSIDAMQDSSDKLGPAYISVGYRGTFAFGRSGQTDVKFRKLSKIYVCGRIAVCRQVFHETLNESRDPDRGLLARYSSRFYLRHIALEMAFDMLQYAGFEMVGSCGSGTNSSGGDTKPGSDCEERRWNHYNEFIFCRSRDLLINFD